MDNARGTLWHSSLPENRKQISCEMCIPCIQRLLCCCCWAAKSCLTFNPMDYSLPGSSVHGIFQATILGWVAIPSSGDLCDPGIKPWWILYYWATKEAPSSYQFLKNLLFLCWMTIKADCFGLFLWEVFLWGPISVRPRHADELKFVFLLLICLMSSLLLVQPQELKEGRGG